MVLEFGFRSTSNIFDWLHMIDFLHLMCEIIFFLIFISYFSFDENMFEDPLHKYESIPLELDDTNFVKKQLDTESAEDDEGPDSVNYSYHPILNYFAQSS